jgi:hypothetical protein
MNARQRTPEEQSRWESYLYEKHSREELASWARRLRYFRFVRDPGGANGGGDSLEVRFNVKDQADLERICRRIGLPLETTDPERPTLQSGKSYTGAEYAALEDPIPPFPAYRQLKWTHIQGIPVFAFVFNNASLQISVQQPDSIWDVNETAIQNAETLEPILDSVAASIIDPPEDDDHCICPKYYPEIWQGSI